MINPKLLSRPSFRCLSLLSLALILGTAVPTRAQNYRTTVIEEGETLAPESDFADPDALRPLTQSDSVLSYQGGLRLMQEAETAMSGQNYTVAAQKLKEARQVFNQLSNFYAQLSDSFSGLEPRISDGHRSRALKTAELRDEATYRLALVHQAQNRPELAVPLLVQIIRSQDPTTPLGQKAYQQIALENPNSILSLQGGQQLMAEAGIAIGSQDYGLASKKLQEARQVFNQLSNFYAQLANSFSGIDNTLAESQRGNALTSTDLRDDATYQLALVHRAQSRPELAVPLLVQIIRSQNPSSDLGKKAYQQLFELGFVTSPYPRPRVSQSN